MDDETNFDRDTEEYNKMYNLNTPTEQASSKKAETLNSNLQRSATSVKNTPYKDSSGRERYDKDKNLITEDRVVRYKDKVYLKYPGKTTLEPLQNSSEAVAYADNSDKSPVDMLLSIFNDQKNDNDNETEQEIADNSEFVTTPAQPPAEQPAPLDKNINQPVNLDNTNKIPAETTNITSNEPVLEIKKESPPENEIQPVTVKPDQPTTAVTNESNKAPEHKIDQIINNNKIVSEFPNITNLDKKLNAETANLPEPPSTDQFSAKAVNVIPETKNIPLAGSTEPELEQVEASINNKSSSNISAINKSTPIQTPINNEIAAEFQKTPSQPAQEQPNKLPNLEKNIPQPQETFNPGTFAQDQIQNIIDSVMNTNEPSTSEASLKNINDILMGLSNNSSRDYKDIKLSLSRLCQITEEIYRVLPSLNMGGSTIASINKPSQEFQSINNGVISQNRDLFRQQYGINTETDFRPNIPGFTV